MTNKRKVAVGLKLPEKAKKKQRGCDLGQASREKVMAESEGNQISLTLNRYFSKNQKEIFAHISVHLVNKD